MISKQKECLVPSIEEGRRLLMQDYAMDATQLAPYLLGKVLCRATGSNVRRVMITQTECYTQLDSACHAHRGRTKRNELMFGRCGIAYVYLCYGLHHLLNVISGEEGDAQGVLLRGVAGADGPAKLTKMLEIDLEHNGLDLVTSNLLWIEDCGIEAEYTAHKRIGIDYAQQADRDRLWRFCLKER